MILTVGAAWETTAGDAVATVASVRRGRAAGSGLMLFAGEGMVRKSAVRCWCWSWILMSMGVWIT